MNRVIVFGTGKKYESNKHLLNSNCIIAFVDNAKEKQGSNIGGVEIISPNDIIKYKYDYIVIMSIYFDNMIAQLEKIGIDRSKVIHYLEIENRLDYVASYSLFNENFFDQQLNLGKKILLISNELSNTGAPIVLFYLARTLKKIGYIPYFFSMRDGELRKQIISDGVPILIESLLSLNCEIIKQLAIDSEYIIFNTAEVGSFIPKFSKLNNNVIWWLHEASTIYEKLYLPCRLEKDIENVNVYAVSEIARLAFFKKFKNKTVKLLPFGIPDVAIANKCSFNSRTLIFSCIGTVHYQKGQDILIKAIRTIHRIYGDIDIKINIIGCYNPNMQEEDFRDNFEKALSEGIIEHKKEISPIELVEIYSQTDVIICPSREESMSAVVIEGMMHSKISIVSNKAGVCRYISHKQNGLIFENDSSEQLSKNIMWCIDNKDKLKQMGKEARKTYLDTFKMEIFEKKIANILGKSL